MSLTAQVPSQKSDVALVTLRYWLSLEQYCRLANRDENLSVDHHPS